MAPRKRRTGTELELPVVPSVADAHACFAGLKVAAASLRTHGFEKIAAILMKGDIEALPAELQLMTAVTSGEYKPPEPAMAQHNAQLATFEPMKTLYESSLFDKKTGVAKLQNNDQTSIAAALKMYTEVLEAVTYNRDTEKWSIRWHHPQKGWVATEGGWKGEGYHDVAIGDRTFSHAEQNKVVWAIGKKDRLPFLRHFGLERHMQQMRMFVDSVWGDEVWYPLLDEVHLFFPFSQHSHFEFHTDKADLASYLEDPSSPGLSFISMPSLGRSTMKVAGFDDEAEYTYPGETIVLDAAAWHRSGHCEERTFKLAVFTRLKAHETQRVDLTGDLGETSTGLGSVGVSPQVKKEVKTEVKDEVEPSSNLFPPGMPPTGTPPPGVKLKEDATLATADSGAGVGTGDGMPTAELSSSLPPLPPTKLFPPAAAAAAPPGMPPPGTPPPGAKPKEEATLAMADPGAGVGTGDGMSTAAPPALPPPSPNTLSAAVAMVGGEEQSAKARAATSEKEETKEKKEPGSEAGEESVPAAAENTGESAAAQVTQVQASAATPVDIETREKKETGSEAGDESVPGTENDEELQEAVEREAGEGEHEEADGQMESPKNVAAAAALPSQDEASAGWTEGGSDGVSNGPPAGLVAAGTARGHRLAKEQSEKKPPALKHASKRKFQK